MFWLWNGGSLRVDSMTSAVASLIFKPLAQALRLSPFTWRSFRRSEESAKRKYGVLPKAQSAMLGHSNPNIPVGVRREGPEALRGAVN
jgi:hypothetical protein